MIASNEAPRRPRPPAAACGSVTVVRDELAPAAGECLADAVFRLEASDVDAALRLFGRAIRLALAQEDPVLAAAALDGAFAAAELPHEASPFERACVAVERGLALEAQGVWDALASSDLPGQADAAACADALEALLGWRRRV